MYSKQASLYLYRCYNPQYAGYKNYGGRGITVCERWHELNNFIEDMGEKPPKTTLDRIDNNGNYEPGNCRWATAIQQARNKSKTVLNEKLVKEIKRLQSILGNKPTAIAKLLSLKKSTVKNVLRGVLWVVGT